MAITEKKQIHPEYKNMKTKMKRQRQTELPRFTVGALALAGASAASGATVQITLTGNKISSTGGNQLVADLTGDGLDDVTFAEGIPGLPGVGIRINGSSVLAFFDYVEPDIYVAKASFVPGGLGTAFRSGELGDGGVSASCLNAVTFSDSRINGGAPTEGWLQVNAFNTSATDHTLEISRLIFDDASTTRPNLNGIPGAQTEFSAVPEPSSLGLLALGAGGLVFRRSRAKAA